MKRPAWSADISLSDRGAIRFPRARDSLTPFTTHPAEAPMTSEELLPSTASETDLLRQQLMRAQRLSSVGTLASSVAHEFNNILTTIINYSKLGLKPTAGEATRLQALE